MIKRVCAVLLIALIGVGSAHAQGVVLAPDDIVALNKTRCGLINGTWVPGTIVKKNGTFYTLAKQISDTNKVLKNNKKLSSSARQRLQLKVAKLKGKLRTQRKACATLSGVIVKPTPVPTFAPTPVETPAVPLPGATIGSWDVTAQEVRDNLGSDYLYFCPPAPASGLRSIYGDYTYTYDSSICVAALHAGLFKRSIGGNVRFVIKGTQPLYIGSLRNGVESSFYGSFGPSFSFLDVFSGAEITAPSIAPISASRSPAPLRGFVGMQFAFLCPAASAVAGGSVWGTDLYTDDSSICRAAVHAGRISNAAGGAVTIEIVPGQASYAGSSRNGVTTNSYGPWSGSFVFVN